MSWMPFDVVDYTGDKFKQVLGGKFGEVVCRVGGEDNLYVVEIGDGSYMLSGSNLVRHKFSDKDREKEPVVSRKHKRKDDDEV